MRIRRSESGFSLVESLIAVALIGLVAVGIVPMFTRAMSDNMAGADYTRVTNFAKSKEEDFSRLTFSQPAIQLLVGQNDLMSTEFFDPTTLRWSQTPPSSLLATWTRQNDISQYSINDSDSNGNYSFTSKLAGGTSALAVHIRQAQVQVQSSSAIGPMGARRTTTIRYLKAF